MDINIICDAIEELEQSDTTVENVQKLSDLYICRDNLIKSHTNENTPIKREINEILPSYTQYCQSKRNFQLGEGSEECMLNDLSLLCCEIKDLYISLYSSSVSHKERKILKSCYSNISLIYEK